MAHKLALLDSGALVAFLSKADRYHMWAVAAFKELPALLLTCEAVLSETFFLLKKHPQGVETMARLLRGKALKVVSLSEELDSILNLIEKYRDAPMSYADACLVRLAELSREAVIVTTDSHFRIYRLRRNQKIPLLLAHI